MNMIKRLVSILFFTLLATSMFSQTIQELQEQKAKLQEELKMTNKLLLETQKSASSSENKLAIIRQTITSRKVLINNLNLQINVLDKNMDTLQVEKNRLSTRLAQLKADYARLLQEAQLRKSSYSQLLFIFSSESISQAYRRLRYLQESSSYRKKQALEILAVRQNITLKQNQLIQTRQSKEVTLSQKEKESNQLASEQKKESQSLSSLKKKNKELQAQLTKQQRTANALNAKIEQAILEEMRREEARRKAQQAKEAAERKAAEERAKKAKKKPAHTTTEEKTVPLPESPKQETAAAPSTSAYVDMMTKEEALVSGNFAANKGRLPWPVEKGFIRGHFGVQPHPVLKHVTTNNKGIYIQAPRNSDARAVFDGVVTQRFTTPGDCLGIIVRHGNYRTVYANLSSVYVKVGDHVSARQRLGRIFVDDENGGKTELYMMLWLDKTVLNPEIWLAR